MECLAGKKWTEEAGKQRRALEEEKTVKGEKHRRAEDASSTQKIAAMASSSFLAVGMTPPTLGGGGQGLAPGAAGVAI